jgi:hypothetical protein
VVHPSRWGATRIPLDARRKRREHIQDGLAEPGGFFAGRAPNTRALYFTAWLDISPGPVTIDAPDTHDRYYVLIYADLYSEVQHSGRRTTGTAAQRVMVVGPGWSAR